MKANEGLRFVLGSIAVYVIMAACAGSGSGPVAYGPDQSSSGGNGSSGSKMAASSGGAASDGSGGTSFLDALTDPVPAAKADANQSGSRLKAKWYVGADGSKQFSGWHDSMLNVDCSFLPASDGSTRCMPITALAAFTFSDPACSQPLAQVANGCAQPAYAYQTTTNNGACASASYRIFQIAAAYGGPFYSGNSANCTAEPDASAAAARATANFYALGSEVAPSTFVQATEQTDP